MECTGQWRRTFPPAPPPSHFHFPLALTPPPPAFTRSNGVEYVSSAEHKTYPFSATQWHPEKPPYEFGMQEIPHSLDAILVSQHLVRGAAGQGGGGGQAGWLCV